MLSFVKHCKFSLINGKALDLFLTVVNDFSCCFIVKFYVLKGNFKVYWLFSLSRLKYKIFIAKFISLAIRFKQKLALVVIRISFAGLIQRRNYKLVYERLIQVKIYILLMQN